jgi:mitogen-activated protein kinase kinase
MSGILADIKFERSLDDIYRRNGPIAIEIVGKVAEAVLRGLMYLYDVHRIIHRGEQIFSLSFWPIC